MTHRLTPQAAGRSRTRRWFPRRSERGAVLVEFTLVGTLLITLAIGVLEIGAAWSDYQSLTQASRSGARVASQLGTDASADAEALLAIEASLGDLASDVTRVVIFEADANGAMPALCAGATWPYNGSGRCNVYDDSAISMVGTSGIYGVSGDSNCGSYDANWCSVTDRADDLTNATYVGVQVEVERSYLSGLFGGGTHVITEATVMRVEPDIE